MRQMRCDCGERLVAVDDDGLVREALLHAFEVHPEMDLGEEQTREMVASRASDTEESDDG